MLVESEEEHFGDRLVRRPVIERDAIGSDKNSGAIFTEFAMDENFLQRRFTHDRKKFRKLRRSRRRKSSDGNRNEMHAERFSSQFFLRTCLRRFTSQIHDGGDAKFFQFVEMRKIRLGAAKQRIRNFSSVRNSGNGDFFGVESGRTSKIDRGSGRLPKWNGREG